MAHVLLAMDADEVYRHLFTAALEGEGHQVTAPTDFWGVLAVLRSTLHPVVCLYFRDLAMRRLLLADDEERMAALEANRADLQRHRYVALSWKFGPLQVPRLAAIEDTLQVEVLPAMPLNLLDVIAAVQRAAGRLSA